MGHAERENFRRELTKLSKIKVKGDGSDEKAHAQYLAQNRRTAEAESKCGPLDRIIVRNQVG